MVKGIINSYESCGTLDGPGIRFVVFLQGCKLRCLYCHNPETWDLKTKPIEITPEELIEKVLRYKSYFGKKGGITFSGGEPTTNAEFLLECLALLAGKVHRAVQTCGFCAPEVFEDVLANCDYMLFDVKFADDALHQKYTGVSNVKILENLRTLAKNGKDFVIRVPLIPTVNDTEENIRQTAELLRDNGISYVELLPYNKMAGAKYKLAGMKYTPSFDERVPVQLRTEIFAAYGITAKKI